MAELQNVIEGLEYCTGPMAKCGYCPYHSGDEMPNSLDDCGILKDAIELLKEQEPIKPTLSVDTWICSKCGHTLESQELIDDKENPQVLIHEQYEYCPCCGRKVNWDRAD